MPIIEWYVVKGENEKIKSSVLNQWPYEIMDGILRGRILYLIINVLNGGIYRMKIFLNREYLEGVTNEHLDLLETEDMQYQKERIQGMINYNIHFCSLVTGYRGTGKSTFVDYVLNGFEEVKEKNVLVVKINAIYYKKYETFIKRFIRELFFQYGGGRGRSIWVN